MKIKNSRRHIAQELSATVQAEKNTNSMTNESVQSYFPKNRDRFAAHGHQTK
jgi:hypothetical protein